MTFQETPIPADGVLGLREALMAQERCRREEKRLAKKGMREGRVHERR
jgi:hypothetical protein